MSKRKASNTALPVAKRRQEELLAHITGNADLLAHLVSIAGRDVAQNITCANRATRVDMRRAMLRKGHTSVAACFQAQDQQRAVQEQERLQNELNWRHATVISSDDNWRIATIVSDDSEELAQAIEYRRNHPIVVVSSDDE